MVKIRLRRQGAKHRPFYRIVAAKSTAARDSSFIEQLGTYDPLAKPAVVKIDADRAMHYLLEGAQPTETAARLLKGQGILDDFFEIEGGHRPGNLGGFNLFIIQHPRPSPTTPPKFRRT